MVLVVGGPKGQLFISDLLVFPWSEFLVAQKVTLFISMSLESFRQDVLGIPSLGNRLWSPLLDSRDKRQPKLDSARAPFQSEHDVHLRPHEPAERHT